MSLSPLKPFVLPNHTKDNRPVTAPPAATKHTSPVSQLLVPPSDEQRPVTAQDGGRANRNRMAANFATGGGGGGGGGAGGVGVSSSGLSPKAAQQVKPTPSESRPQSHAKKRSQSPLSRGQDFLEESDTDNVSESSYASLELKLLKAILASRKSSKKSSRKYYQEGVSDSGTVSASPYRGQYTPEKYVSPSRRSVRRSRADDRNEHEEVTDEIRSREEDRFIDTVEGSESELERTMAATKLQSIWRGFLARHKDPDVVRVRHEMRARRSEDHIRYLRNEVDRQKALYEQEKHLRILQLEAVRHLFKEVTII